MSCMVTGPWRDPHSGLRTVSVAWLQGGSAQGLLAGRKSASWVSSGCQRRGVETKETHAV